MWLFAYYIYLKIFATLFDQVMTISRKLKAKDSLTDQFFIQKMNPVFSQVTSLVEAVARHGGIISVDLLAEKHHLTTRTVL